eukprot:CAMPEP_0114539114 /NCGR_PEP_ID=MMETSP0114-20121206/66_1 /TAXON_ID=31324 /ORGANISM="Goniomonas sp, Strain m" /LENGTH=40 /DNA_ID= /DNA_START= /DNA_END= /DNA_ORIENTATION=
MGIKERDAPTVDQSWLLPTRTALEFSAPLWSAEPVLQVWF